MSDPAHLNPVLIQQAADLLPESRSVLVITGAGLSADSGLPTYRGIGGLYEGRDTDEDIPIEVVMSGEALRLRPELTWKYLLQIEQTGRHAQPSRGHKVLVEMESRFERFWVLTQNVDGLHQKAGSRNVIAIHGNLLQIHCLRCPHSRSVANYEGFALPPKCPDCRGVLRPAVTLFGEQLPASQLATYQAETKRGFDLVLSVGTTSQFPYIAGPVLDAYHFRKPSIEINPGETDVTEFVTVKLPYRAAAALDAVWAAFNAS